MCPRCKSHEVRRSRSKNLIDLLMRTVGMRPVRCDECRKRFYVPYGAVQKLKAQRAWLHGESPRRMPSDDKAIAPRSL